MQVTRQVIDQQLGLAFVQLFNPDFRRRIDGVVSQVLVLLRSLAVFIILVRGHIAVILVLLLGSFENVPPLLASIRRYGEGNSMQLIDRHAGDHV